MPNIPDGLGSMELLLRRFAKARKNWEQWRSLHQEAYDFSIPDREHFRFRTPGQRQNRHIFDSTATQGVHQFASRIQGSLVPSWRQWADLVPSEEVSGQGEDELGQELEDSTNILFNHLNHSNFDTEITSSFVDLSIGTGGILVEENEFGTSSAVGSAFRFTNVPLNEIYPEKPPRGSIESSWRKFKIGVSFIERIWPEAEIPADLQKIKEMDANKEVDIIIGYLFNAKDELYYQLVIYQPSKSLMFVQSSQTKRLIVFRWSVAPNEVFGRGPIIQMLSDIRTANKVKEFMLGNANLQITGIYTAVDDGVFNPHTVTLTPGSIIPVQSNNTQSPTLRALERSGSLELGQIVLNELQDGIKRALFVDPLGDLTDPVRTATEMQIRQQEMLKIAGAQIGRLKSELVDPLVAACVDVLSDLGLIEPIVIGGREITIRQNSPLAKAEGSEDFQTIQVWLGSLAALPPEVLMGAVKVEDIPGVSADMLGVTQDLLRTDAERQAIGEAFVQQAQQVQDQGGAIE